ncbi:MAG TPA: LCP family protein [Intrasporangium sp.]|uniref:LCP family glycopolymer transferase n=1 Tax=Intrasporangium sp. TaxID=1925024 RepID=UPI002B49E6CD|nr:LCP family protein [Intrasporangium sp.]HKX68957.1 LCP family protein [Intrasporangium sp.]
MSDEPRRRTEGSGGRRSLRRELSAGFRRAIGLTALGTLLPGAGLTRTRSRAWGWGLLVVFLASVVAVAYLILTRGPTRVGLVIASNTRYLLAVTIVLAIGGFIWCASIIATAVQSRPRRLDRARTRSLAIFTTVMVVLIGGASYKGAEFALIGRDTVDVIFKDSSLRPGQGAHVAEGEDPWADTPRVNILLLGSDAGVGRDGTRTDSMIVASTDTKTGRTVLISLPRNLQRVPLPETSKLRERWPSGTYGVPSCPRQERDANDQCMLNAIWSEVDQFREENPDAFPDDDVPGRSETRDVIGEILGLKIDHTVVVDLEGFSQLVNAMGGVTINVKLGGYDGRTPIPYGARNGDGSYAHYFDTPGPMRMNGYQALWYARSRAADDDYNRMSRQRCVVQAVVGQVSPTAMLAKYAEIAQIARENIYTDIPAANLPAFVELVERIQKSGKFVSVGIDPSHGIHPGNPDYEQIRALVAKAITPPEPKPSGPSAEPGPSEPESPSSPTRTPTPSPDTTTSPAEVDACA